MLNVGRSTRSVAAAFTLVELLCVVAVIGILAAILFPVISNARKAARQAECGARLHGLAAAFQSYVQDNHGCLPDPDDGPNMRWPQYLAPYIGPYTVVRSATTGRITGLAGGSQDILALPLFHDPVQAINPANSGAGVFGYNINLNHTYGKDTPNGSAVRQNSFSRPPTFPVLCTTEADVSGGVQMVGTAPSPAATKQGWTGATNYRGPMPLFGRNAFFLFADWHVEPKDVCNPGAWPWNKADAFMVQ